MKSIHQLHMLVLIAATIAYAPSVLAADNNNRDTYVTLSGSVGPITDDDEFTLNYGSGSIEVDTNDAWPNLFRRDANNAAKALNEGDRVVVSGRIDNDWFGERELDAYSLRHQTGGKVFNYESTKRSNAPGITLGSFDDKDRVTVTGTINKVINDNRYQMQYGSAGNIEIDTTGITGGKGQHFKVGDRVTLTGKLDDTFFGKREINVDTIHKK